MNGSQKVFGVDLLFNWVDNSGLPNEEPNMQVVTLTADQSTQMRRLRNAQWMIEQARQEIMGALGGTDVGDEYALTLFELNEDLVLDIESIGQHD
jgi:DNA-binding protein Fis